MDGNIIEITDDLENIELTWLIDWLIDKIKLMIK
jgi:hypothetical protein